MTDIQVYDIIGNIFYKNPILNYASYDAAHEMVRLYILNEYNPEIVHNIKGDQFDKEFDRFWTTDNN